MPSLVILFVLCQSRYYYYFQMASVSGNVSFPIELLIHLNFVIQDEIDCWFNEDITCEKESYDLWATLVQ